MLWILYAFEYLKNGSGISWKVKENFSRHILFYHFTTKVFCIEPLNDQIYLFTEVMHEWGRPQIPQNYWQPQSSQN